MSKIITISQQKGGTGKTTLAAQLAVGFKNIYNKILIVDIDPQGSLSYWYNLRCDNLENPDIDSIKMAGWKASSELNRLKNSYDLILVDCPPHTDTDTKTVIRTADLVIIPLQASPTDLWATKTTIEFAQNEDKKIILVLNRVTHNSKLATVITQYLPNLPLLLLTQKVAFANSMMYGKAVIETEPNSSAAEELKKLVRQIDEYLK